MMFLTRFRADPALVRVGIRPHKGLWYVTISSRPLGRGVIERMHKSPKGALVLALRAAEAVGFPGIDLGMGSAYEHPWGALAPRDRVTRVMHDDCDNRGGACTSCRHYPEGTA